MNPRQPLVPFSYANHPIRFGTLIGLPDRVISYPVNQLFGNGHMAIYGGTGKGKSKLAEHILRQVFHLDDAPGGIVIDPHGDLVESLLLYVRQCPDLVNSRIVENLHFVELEGEHTFSLDPFDPIYYRKIHRRKYRRWLEAQAERVALGIIRMKGEYSFRGMAQLARYMKALLIAAGTALDEAGHHLPLSDMDILYMPKHPDYEELYELVVPRLSRRIRHDIDEIRELRPEKRSEALNSTINRFNDFFSELTRPIFACQAPTLDIPAIVDAGGWLFVNLATSSEACKGHADAVGSILLRLFVDEIAGRRRITDRNPFILWIDEASRFIGDDIIQILRENRKHKLSCCLCVQDLDALDNDQVKMARQVTGLCDHQFTFQQKNEEDMLKLASIFAFPNFRFEKLYSLSNLTLGHSVVELIDRHEGVELGDMKGAGHSMTANEALKMLQGTQSMLGEEWGIIDSESEQLQRSHELLNSREYASGVEHSQSEESATSTRDALASAQETASIRKASQSQSTSHDVAQSKEDARELQHAVSLDRHSSKSNEHSEDKTHTISEGNRLAQRRDHSTAVSRTQNSTRRGLNPNSRVKSNIRAVEARDTTGTIDTEFTESSDATRIGNSRKSESGITNRTQDTTSDSSATRLTETDRQISVAGTEDGRTDKESQRRSHEKAKTRNLGQRLTHKQSETEKRGESHGLRLGSNIEHGRSHAIRNQRSVQQNLSQEIGLARQTSSKHEESYVQKIGETTKQILMAIQPVLRQDTGNLKDQITNQIYRIFSHMRLLDVAEVMHVAGNKPSLNLKVDDVSDPVLLSPFDRQKLIDHTKQIIVQARPYNYLPPDEVEAEQQRMTEFFQAVSPYLRHNEEAKKPLALPAPTAATKSADSIRCDQLTAFEF